MTPVGTMTQSRPADCYELRFDMSPVLDYLRSSLDPGLIDEDTPAAVLNLLIASIVDLTTDWHCQSQLEQAVSLLVDQYGFEQSFVYDVCRTADNMISGIILTHVRDFGSDHYYGQVTHSIFYDSKLCLYVNKAAYKNGQAPRP